MSPPTWRKVKLESQKIIHHTVDGRKPAPVEVGSYSHDLQGFSTSQKLQSFSINSTSAKENFNLILVISKIYSPTDHEHGGE